MVCTLGVIAGVILEHTGIVLIMILGGFISSLADDAIQIRTDAKLNDMFPSEQRATLVSISSFTFSVIMIVLSPLAGYFFSIW
jgi:MFS family permease